MFRFIRITFSGSRRALPLDSPYPGENALLGVPLGEKPWGKAHAVDSPRSSPSSTEPVFAGVSSLISNIQGNGKRLEQPAAISLPCAAVHAGEYLWIG